jgi:Na+-driven multidrug efflux pump
MIAIVTILCAFPLGFFVSSRLAANTAYAIAYLWAFVFQGIYLMLDSINHGDTLNDDPAFVAHEFPWQYGVVTLLIFMTGFGLVAFGHRVGRGRRERRQESSRSSLTGTIASAASGNTAASANVAG